MIDKIPLFISIIILFVSCVSTPDLDIYISNAKIIDGSGSEAYNSNLGIKDNKIAYISNKDLKLDSSVLHINANGKVLSPGFIDMHSHGNPEKTPEFENFLAMGVTTITLGQDGSSPKTSNIQSWMQKAGSDGLGTNIVMFVGHGTLRNLVGIGSNRNPTKIQLDSLKSLLDNQLEYTFGLSTGLEYTPGLYANSEELLTLAKIVGNKDKMIMSHMRNEDDEALFESIEELAEQGKHCQVQIAHLKSVYGKGSERAAEILEYIKGLRAEGIEITADIYPYTASYTGIGILFPEWSKTADQFNIAKTERRKELEDFLRNKVNKRNGPSSTLIGTKPFAGKTLSDLENQMGIPFEDILIDSIGPQGASGAYFVMNEELQETLIKDPLTSICSDGSPSGYHPRGHGTFARVIEEFVLNRNALSLEEAIRKMTSYPAQILQIKDRGLIKVGNLADLVLFNPESVREKATFEDPFQLSEGFDYVIVNGKIARQNGMLSEALNGIFLNPEN